MSSELSFPGHWALIPVLGAVLIITAGSKAWFNRTILSNPIAVWFGFISFPLYLWHWPLLSFAKIVEGECLSRKIRISAIFLSILLGWLTARFIEKPIRFGSTRTGLKLTMLCGILFVIGVSGLIASRFNFSQSHVLEKLVIRSKYAEFSVGPSVYWYKGKQDWLFMSNAFDQGVAKLKLAIIPSDNETEATKAIFAKIVEVSAKFNTKVALIVGPNKSTIYPEYLPDEIQPSADKYITYYLDKLKSIPNLTVYDPTDDLLNAKKTNGILYSRTDTHWNNKGAFLAYSGFANLLGLPIPEVEFKQGTTHAGDLIGMCSLKDFPLRADDNWDVIWKNKQTWVENKIPYEHKTVLGSPRVSINDHPLVNQYVWVVGDSFTLALSQYFNAVFKEVRYVGHWNDKLENLPENLSKVDRKPDMIIIVRVERSF